MNGAAEVHAQIVARLCRILAPRHLLLAGTQDEALCRALAAAAAAHDAILHVATRHPPAWLASVRAAAGDRCIVHQANPADVVGVVPLPDLAWLDDDANWFAVHRLLQGLHARAERFARPYPLTLVAGAGWPSARRDSYADPGAIPAAHRHAHERAGLVPGRDAPGAGLYADRFNAVAENEPGNGVLTAIEDFLAGRAAQLRLTLLPGFGGLAALCSRTGPASEAFAPAGLAQDMLAMAQALETARLEGAVRLAGDQHALRNAEALIGKLRPSQQAAAPTQAAAPSPVSLAAALLPLRRRVAALLPRRPAPAGPEDDQEEQAALARLKASPIFDAAWYNATYGDVAEAGTDPALHYLRDGAAELRDPGPYFSTAYYLESYPDVAAENLNPLLHYLANGAAEGRNPGAHFATRHYAEAHPEVAASGLNPLEHYLTVGRAAGWQAPPSSALIMTRWPRSWARAVWRLHNATPAAILLSLASLPVLAQSLASAMNNLVWPAWHDIWDVVPDYQRWLDGQYGWRDLVAPYYEHRIVLTRALLLLDAALDRMAGRIPEAVAVALLAGLGLLVWRLVRLDEPAQARPDTPPLFWIALLGAICQYENIDLPFQVQFPIACFSAGLATLLLARATMVHGRRAGWLAAAAGLAAIVAAFSMGSGVLLAPCLVVMLALRRARLVVWAVFTPICALGVMLFFQGHASAGQPGPPLLDWHLAITRAVYGCNFLASSLAAYPLVATFAGACGLLLFGLLCAALARDYVAHGQPVPAGDAALFALCLMVVLCAPAGTLTARLLMGVHAALASRYATMSLLFAATLLGLCVRQAATMRPGDWAGSAVAVAGLAGMLAVNAPIYAHRAAAFQRVIVADAQLLINNVGVEGRNAPIIMGSVNTVRGGIAILHANRLNIFDPRHGPPVASLARLNGLELAGLPVCRGYLDAAYAVDGSAFLVSGWIADQAGRHTVPWIAALDEAGHLLGTARALTERPDVRAALALPETAYGFGDGFRLRAPAPAGTTTQVRLLGLSPGAASPICALAAPALVGPLPILPAARLQGATPTGLRSPPVIEGAVKLDSVKAWRLDTPPARVPGWGFLALGHPDAQARIVFRPVAVPAGQSLAIPFSMADAAPGRSLTVKMTDGSVIGGAFQSAWHDDGWRAAVVPAELMKLHGGVDTVEIRAAGEVWLAVGAPVAASFAPEWSRLF